MADKDLGIIELNRKEHDDSLGIAGKRVFPWGFDGADVQPLSVDTDGKLNIGSSSATIYAVVNTGAANSNVTLNPSPNQIGSVTVSNPIQIQGFSGPTIYAVVNTGAVGTQNALTTLNAGPNQIGSVTISHPITIQGFSGPTIYAVVNTGAVGTQNALTTLNAGPNQIGSVTISHTVNVNIASLGVDPLSVGGDQGTLEQYDIGTPASLTFPLGVAVVDAAGNQITSFNGGVVTIANELTALATVNVSNIINSLATVNLASAATIFAVVNTGAVGTQNALTTLNAGPNQIGSVTISHVVNVDATGQGDVPITLGGEAVVLDTGTKQIGSVTVSNIINSLATVNLASAATIFAVVNTGAVGTQNALTTLNAGPNQIGSVTISHVVAVDATGQGDVPITLGGEAVVLGAGTAQIGSVTVSNIVNALATVNVSNVINGIVTVAPRTDYIGLASISGQVVNLAGTAQMGSVTVSSIGAGVAQVGSVTVSSIGPGTATIGIVRLTSGATVVAGAGVAQIGSVTVSNTVNALATVTNTFLSSNYTSFATVISSTATLFTVPNGQRWVLKDLIVGSMGKNTVQVSTHTIVVIPPISLATQGGYVANFGDSGLRGNVSGAFVVGLGATATVAVSANVRFEA